MDEATYGDEYGGFQTGFEQGNPQPSAARIGR
jgi:hypothetical protein